MLIPGVKYVYPYMLFGAVGAIVERAHSENRVINKVHLLSPAGGTAVLLAWALLTAVVGAGITMNRDIT